MKGREIFNRRVVLPPQAFTELVAREVPFPVPGCAHGYKSRLAFVVNGKCVLRYDKEQGKGDHKHLDDEETPYAFSTPTKLVTDFWNDVTRMQK